MNIGINYTAEQIFNFTKGQWLHKSDENPTLSYLSLDSRKIIFPQQTIFFAVKNIHQNGNLFIKGLYKKGVRNFVTDDKDILLNEVYDANIILVTNTIEALQKVAIAHRQAFKNKITIIGITGSNGKTILKEWLNQLLEKEFSIVRSPKSFNSQIGVPLSVLNIKPSNQIGIFEAGISLPSEMKNLEKIIQPEIGIFTNIGNAHDEGFISRKQKIREKLILFKHAHQLIFPANEEILTEIFYLKEKNPGLKLFSWGKKEGATLKIQSIKKTNSISTITGIYKRKKVLISIPFTDEASIENAISCWCLLFILNKTDKDIFDQFKTLYPVAMRLELKQGINHSTIINDSYSNDLYSLSIAIDFLNQQKQHAVHSVILSDILQSGRGPNDLYKNVASLLLQNKIENFYGIGPDIFSQQQEFNFLKNKYFFKTTESFLKTFPKENFHDETILIKGARPFKFEKITAALVQKVHQTMLSINLSALVFNLKKYKEKLLPQTKLMAMVKAFSYGSGSHEIASVLEFNKADYLSVAYADEGVELRKAGISLPIMVLNIDNSTFDSILNYNLEPEIFSFKILSDLLNFVKSSKKVCLPVHIKIDTGMHRLGFMEEEIDDLCKIISGNDLIKVKSVFSFKILSDFLNFIKSSKKVCLPVHIKIDTGMHRLGFMEEEIDDLCKIISSNELIEVKSVFSHLAASEDEKEDAFTLQQFNLFEKCCDRISLALGYKFDKHISNTSAISRHPKLQMNMVRLGIGLYGIDSNKKMQKELKNVSSLSTTISQIKKLKAGETVGYGRAAKLEKDKVIAVVRIGYADGYHRNLGNGNGKMMVQNKLVPVIGNVCMDMTMLDISGIKNIKEGDEVIVFGEALPLEKLAEWAGTIPYEILTGISQRVKRVYFEE